jgi:hypothetical protein
MNGVKTLSPERIAEIKAFKNIDFSDCPILTEDELKNFGHGIMNISNQKKWGYKKYLKTVQEYLSDPRMLNDPGMVKALEQIKEIYAIRLKLQDETAGMTEAGRIEYINKKGREALARNGLLARLANLSAQGKLS